MQHLDALALLDLEGSEHFVLPGGVELRPAADLPYDHVIAALQDTVAFVKLVAGGARMSLRDAARLQAFWRRREALVDGDDLRRLLWIVGTFQRELEADLLQRVGVRLGDLWQRRDWRLLLNLIDHLPRNTWAWQAMANHPEYAEILADAMAKQRLKSVGEEPAGAPLVEHSPEVAALSSVVDAVNALRTTIIQANSKPGAQIPKIPPYPRPRTLVDSMVDKKERALRWAAHHSLTSRLLPGRS